MRDRTSTKSKVIRIKRIAHTKAGGRVLRYQGLAIYGNGQGQFGWATCKASSPQDCKIRSIKKAGSRMRRILFDQENRTFRNDLTISFGKYKVKLKRRQKGTGITASPLVSMILNFSGIENACVKVVNKPDVLLLVRKLSDFLHGSF